MAVMLHGVLLQLLPRQLQLVAGVVVGAASLGPVCALLALLLLQDATDAGVVAWAEALQLLSSGYLIVCGLLFCWPVALEWHRKKAVAGGVLGMALVLAASGLLGALCWATPYCIRTS